MKTDSLGDWCKWLEANFTPERAIPKLPVIIRLDGENFSSWTKGLDRPFDVNFAKIMDIVTIALVKKTGAVIGYTQSDEITLILFDADKNKSIYNDGKKSKIVSKLAAFATATFNDARLKFLPSHNKLATFDCRMYQTPTLHDAAVQLLWRENDASKNSISMLARHYFSHNEVDGKNGSEMQEMLFEKKGVNWNDLDVRFKRGVYFKNQNISTKFDASELETLHPKHAARLNPDLVIERKRIVKMEWPKMSSISNMVDVIFNDADIILKN